MAGLIERGLQFVLSAKDAMSDVFKRAGKSVDDLDKNVSATEQHFQKLQGAIAALGVASAVQEFVRLNAQLEAQRNALTSILGSQEAATAKMAEMRGTADLLGQSATSLTDQYIQLAAATKGTALEGEATDQVFNAIVGAMGKLGRGSEETSRALAAVAQMASKGVVAAEEMRGQLGEALPGAMQALSNATGITVGDLNKMMESGQLLATDVLPALAKGLNDTFGTDIQARVESLGASVERLKNSAMGAFTEIGQAGVSAFATWLTDKATVGVAGLTAGMVSLGKNIGATAAYAAGAIPNWAEYTQALEENNAEGQKYIDRAAGVTQAAAKQSEALATLAASALKSAQVYTEASKNAKTHEEAVKAQGEAATSAARAELARAKVLGDQVGILKATEALEQAELKAKQDNAKAAQDLAKVTQERVTGLQGEIAALKAAAAAREIDQAAAEKGAEAKGKQVETLQKTLTTQQAAADKALELAAAQEAETQQAKINTLIHGDQAEVLDQLVSARDKVARAAAKAKDEAEALAKTQERLTKTEADLIDSQIKGLNVGEALAKVQSDLSKTAVDLTAAQAEAKDAATALAVAQAQVADAAHDAQDALERQIDDLQRENDLRLRSRDLLVQDLTHRRDLALARHEESAAAQLTIQLYEQEIRQSKDAAAAKREESRLLEEKARAKQLEAEATDVYTEAEKAQVDAIHDAARAASLEADALDQQAKFKRDQIHETERLAQAERLLKEATTAVSDEVAKATEISQAAAEAAQKAGDAALKQAEAEGDLAHASERAGHAASQAAESVRIAELAAKSFALTIEGTGRSLDGLGQYADIARSKFDELVASSEELSTAIMMGSANTLLGHFADMAVSAAIAAKRQDELTAALEGLRAKLDDDQISLGEYTRHVEALGGQYRSLGEERLQSLRDALADAKARTEALRQSAADALAAALEAVGGNEREIEQLRYERLKAELEQQLLEAKGDAEAEARLRRALELQRHAHEEKLRQIAEEEAARRKADGGTGSGGGTSPSAPSPGGPIAKPPIAYPTTPAPTGSGGNQAFAGALRAAPSKVFQLDLTAGARRVSLYGEEADAGAVLDLLEQARRRSL